MYRAPQRSYTPSTLEAWLERLTKNWEAWFSNEEIKWGQSYYRTNQARSTELLEDSAIIHFGSRKEEIYIIIDWDMDKPTFRISHPGIGPGVGLGIAGLYELEEFLADELPPVSEFEAADAKKTDRGIENNPRKQARIEVKAEKFLRVNFEATYKGILMKSGWEDAKGHKIPGVKMTELNSVERESFIRLTTLAHRSGFNHAENSKISYLTDPSGIQIFLNQGIDRWKRQLKVDVDPQLNTWRRGIRDLLPILKVSSNSGEGARFEWNFSFKGDRLDEDERQRIFRQTRNVHFLPGKGMVRLDPSAQLVIDEWKASGYSKENGELPKYLLFSFLSESVVQLDLSPEIQRWREQVENTPAVNNFLPSILRPYQKEGVKWLGNVLQSGCHGLLADEMGLGKTLQVLTYLDEQGGLQNQLSLIVCPSSVVPVWEAEIRDKFPSARFKVLSKKNPFEENSNILWITSYSQLRRHRQDLIKVNFNSIILDEAQTIKNPDAKTTQACFVLNGKNRIVLTGTPIENRPLDLWTLFRFLMPGLLGSRNRFLTRIKDEGESFQRQLRQQIEPFILRRTKAKVLTELPPKMIVNWRCPLTSQQKKMYRDIAEKGITEFGDNLQENLSERAVHLFTLLTRLRQACCDPSLVSKTEGDWNHSGKLVSMINRLEEAIANGSKVVIFSQFVQFLNRIEKAISDRFPELPLYKLTGQTLDRSKPVEAFQKIKEPAVFLISLKAGGTGLNLQSADYVFLMDPWWNPAVEAQAVDRVHRFGQANKVCVYRFLTVGTIEERIELLKNSKQELFDRMLGDLDQPKNIFDHFNSMSELIGIDEDDETE